MTVLPKTLLLLLPILVLTPLACTAEDDVDLGQNGSAGSGATTGSAGSKNSDGAAQAGTGAKSAGSGGGNATGGTSAATGGTNATGGSAGSGGSGTGGATTSSGGTGTPGSGGAGVGGWNSDLSCEQIKAEYSKQLLEARKCNVPGHGDKCTKQLPNAPDETCSCPASIEEGWDTTALTQLAAAWDDKKCPRSSACPKCALPIGVCEASTTGGVCK